MNNQPGEAPGPKRRRRRGLAAVAGFLGVLGLVVWWQSRAARITFEGRTAAEWFDLALVQRTNVEAACRAMRALGPESVPVLIDALRGETGQTGSRMWRLHQKLPAGLQRWLSAPVTPRQRSDLAMAVLPELRRAHRREIGRAAFAHLAHLVRDPAGGERSRIMRRFVLPLEPPVELLAPLLVELVDDPDPTIRYEALRLITDQADPRDGRGGHFRGVVPKIIPWLRVAGGTNREIAIDVLEALGPAARDAVPELEALAMEPGYFERTAFALWWIDRQTNRILPMVRERLDSDVRSITVIGDLGPAARPFVPRLANAITHPKIEIAFESVIAVARIDPDQIHLVTETLLAWVNRPGTPVDYVRLSIEALAELKIDTPEVRRALKRKHQHHDRGVRRASREALIELGVDDETW